MGNPDQGPSHSPEDTGDDKLSRRDFLKLAGAAAVTVATREGRAEIATGVERMLGKETESNVTETGSKKAVASISPETGNAFVEKTPPIPNLDWEEQLRLDRDELKALKKALGLGIFDRVIAIKEEQYLKVNEERQATLGDTNVSILNEASIYRKPGAQIPESQIGTFQNEDPVLFSLNGPVARVRKGFGRYEYDVFDARPLHPEIQCRDDFLRVEMPDDIVRKFFLILNKSPWNGKIRTLEPMDEDWVNREKELLKEEFYEN